MRAGKNRPDPAPGPESVHSIFSLSLNHSAGEAQLLLSRSAQMRNGMRCAGSWLPFPCITTFKVRLFLTRRRVSVHSFIWLLFANSCGYACTHMDSASRLQGTRTWGSTGSGTYAPPFVCFCSHVRITEAALLFRRKLQSVDSHEYT
jgi:hypothetical protein